MHPFTMQNLADTHRFNEAQKPHQAPSAEGPCEVAAPVGTLDLTTGSKRPSPQPPNTIPKMNPVANSELDAAEQHVKILRALAQEQYDRLAALLDEMSDALRLRGLRKDLTDRWHPLSSQEAKASPRRSNTQVSNGHHEKGQTL